MRNLSIKIKLWGALCFYLLFFVIIWALSWYTSEKINTYLDPSGVELMEQSVVLSQSLREVVSLLIDAPGTGEWDTIIGPDGADEQSRQFINAIDIMKELDGAHKGEYEAAQIDFSTYFNISRRMVRLMVKEKKDLSEDPELLAQYDKVATTLASLHSRVEKIYKRNYDTFGKLLNQSIAAASSLTKRNSLLLLFAILTSLIIAPIAIRTITGPIVKLVEATNQLASGNLDAKAQVVYRDEIGDLAVAFNEMTRSLKEKTRELENKTMELEEAGDELKMANSELHEANRLKSRFLASMSHELRTPLNAIINFSEQIIEDWEYIGGDSPEDKEWTIEANGYLKRVFKSSKHLLSLINELLDLAKIESGHMGLTLAKADVREIVADAVASVYPLAKEKDLKLGHSWPDDLPDLMIDEKRVLQIFINLLSNAIKFTEVGSIQVEVSRAPDNDGIHAKVIDSGIGISENERTIIFDRFRQADGADSRTYSGTGLGLNLVKELAELHGGWISVESSKSEGSVFTLFLPYTPPRTESKLLKQ